MEFRVDSSVPLAVRRRIWNRAIGKARLTWGWGWRRTSSLYLSANTKKAVKRLKGIGGWIGIMNAREVKRAAVASRVKLQYDEKNAVLSATSY